MGNTEDGTGVLVGAGGVSSSSRSRSCSVSTVEGIDSVDADVEVVLEE